MHLDTALALVEEMRSRNIQPNTHTYSSLLNVCVKAGQLNMALGVYNEVRGRWGAEQAGLGCCCMQPECVQAGPEVSTGSGSL